MIDLTSRGLPNTLVVSGKPFSIYTDFRVWMRLQIQLDHYKKGDFVDCSYLFKNDIPRELNFDDLIKFLKPANKLPRPMSGGSTARVIDFEIDSDYIYAAFLGQYGIDLIDVDHLHWHKFLALLNGLNDSTRLKEIMGYRCYKKSKDKNVDIYERLKFAWDLEDDDEVYDDDELKQFSDLFKYD